MRPYRNAAGEPFEVHTVKTGYGIECRKCGRTIRYREKFACFDGDEWECRDCLYSEPFTEFNRWRKEHPEHERND